MVGWHLYVNEKELMAADGLTTRVPAMLADATDSNRNPQ
jgi:hypothetical protein